MVAFQRLPEIVADVALVVEPCLSSPPKLIFTFTALLLYVSFGEYAFSNMNSEDNIMR